MILSPLIILTILLFFEFSGINLLTGGVNGLFELRLKFCNKLSVLLSSIIFM